MVVESRRERIRVTMTFTDQLRESVPGIGVASFGGQRTLKCGPSDVGPVGMASL